VDSMTLTITAGTSTQSAAPTTTAWQLDRASNLTTSSTEPRPTQSGLATHYPHMIGKVWIYRLLFACVCVRLRISPARMKLPESNFARWFRGVLGRKSPILEELCSCRSPKWDESARLAAASIADRRQSPTVTASVRGTLSACVDIRRSPKTDVLVLLAFAQTSSGLLPNCYYPHMPIGKAWLHRLLFVFLFVCLFVCAVKDFSSEYRALN